MRHPVPAVTLVTHSSPGGGSDVFRRELIKHLHSVMGGDFAVENVRCGWGATAVAHAKANPGRQKWGAANPPRWSASPSAR